MTYSFRELFDDIPDIHIVDIGASPIEGKPIYQPILEQGGYRLTGFEPNPHMYEKLLQSTHPQMTFLPYAIGDGTEATLNICTAPGMCSLLEPDFDTLSHFHGFSEWAEVIEKQPLKTHRLDDIQDVKHIDFFKLDVQGAELTIFENATEKLKNTLMIHTEVCFIPLYQGQPLFGEIDVFLRKAGFQFHRFGRLASRIFKPLLKNNDIYRGMSQILWSDAVYLRPFTQFKNLRPEELLKTARMLHDIYGSFDLAQLALMHVDAMTGSQRQKYYIDRLISNNNPAK